MQVSRTRKEIAQLIGAVFIQKSNVNLLSTVLDTPEYFWSAPDNLQVCPSPLHYSHFAAALYIIAHILSVEQQLHQAGVERPAGGQ